MSEETILSIKITKLISKNKRLAHQLTTKNGKCHRLNNIVKTLQRNNLLIESYKRKKDLIENKV